MTIDPVQKRIDSLLVTHSESLTLWEQGFVESIASSLKKWGRLTTKQHNLFQKIEARFTPEKIQEREEWRNSFTEQQRAEMQVIANYYRYYSGGYYPSESRKILEDPEYVPPQPVWNKMRENKYSQGVVANAFKEPEFPAGTFAFLRTEFPIRSGDSLKDHYLRIREFKNKPVLIVEHGVDVASHAKNAKPVHVLVVGTSISFWTEERGLKKTGRGS